MRKTPKRLRKKNRNRKDAIEENSVRTLFRLPRSMQLTLWGASLIEELIRTLLKSFIINVIEKVITQKIA